MSQVADALRDTLISPNVADSNFEAANVVDALAKVASSGFAIAKSLLDIAAAIREGNAKAIDMESLDHAICMGIRHGLFGSEARQDSDIRDKKE